MQLANADRTVRKQQKIDNIRNAFSREEVDNKACRAWISAGLPLAVIDNEDVTAWTKALRMASSSYKDPGRKRLSGSLLDRNHRQLEADMNVRDSRTNREVGFTVNIDAGEDDAR